MVEHGSTPQVGEGRGDGPARAGRRGGPEFGRGLGSGETGEPATGASDDAARTPGGQLPHRVRHRHLLTGRWCAFASCVLSRARTGQPKYARRGPIGLPHGGHLLRRRNDDEAGEARSEGRALRRTRVTTSTRCQLPEEEQLVYDPKRVAHRRPRRGGGGDGPRPASATGWIGTDLTSCTTGTGTPPALLASAIERRHGLDGDVPVEREAGSEVEYDLSGGTARARHAHRPAHRGRRALPLGGWSARRHRGGRGAAWTPCSAPRSTRSWSPAVACRRSEEEPGRARCRALRRPSTTLAGHPNDRDTILRLNEGLFEQSEAGPGAVRRRPVLVGADPRPGVGPARPLARRRGRRLTSRPRPRGPRGPAPLVSARPEPRAGRDRYLDRHGAGRAARCGTPGPSPRPGGSRSGTWCCPSTPHREASDGLLVGAVVAAYLRPGVDEAAVPDIYRLVNEIERGQRVVQPRLRHTLAGRPPRPGPQHPPADRGGRGDRASTSRTTARRCSRSSARVRGRAAGAGRDARSPACCTGRCAGTVRRPASIAHLAGDGRGRLALGLHRDPVAWALDVARLPARDRRSRSEAGRPGQTTAPA